MVTAIYMDNFWRFILDFLELSLFHQLVLRFTGRKDGKYKF